MSDRLLQEILLEQDRSGFRMLVGCILLNRTTRRQVDAARHDLFTYFPCAHDLMRANERLEEALRPLGLWRRRAKTLRDFGEWWYWREPLLPANVHEIRELQPPGVGEYAAQSWDIFVEGVLPREKVTDRVLLGYLERHAGASGVIW